MKTFQHIPLSPYPKINDPIWQQFDDPYRAWSNYFSLYHGYLAGSIRSKPDTDHAQHAYNAANKLEVSK